jgi:acyl-[acyl-carrier-protein] desaturase
MRVTRYLSDAELLRELEPTVATNLDRHLVVAQEWLPHEWVPWSRGRDFTGDDGLAWTPEQSRLSEAARAAFEVNLLTEDNLPSYHHELALRLGRDGAWGAWLRRWTAEEARHATSIRDYLILSRAVDPAALERARMTTMQIGWAAGEKGVLQSLVYVTFQELATRIAHWNTGRVADDPVADRLLARIAADENLHMVFYRDLIAAALALAPEQTIVAIAAEAVGFQMPGAGVPGFLRKSVQVAEVGIYDVRRHRDEVVAPLVRQWRALTLPVTTDAARRAQEDLARHLERLEQMARRYEARRAFRHGPAPPARTFKPST